MEIKYSRGSSSQAVGGPPGAEPWVCGLRGLVGLREAGKGSEDFPSYCPHRHLGASLDSYSLAPFTEPFSPCQPISYGSFLHSTIALGKNSRPAILYIIPP